MRRNIVWVIFAAACGGGGVSVEDLPDEIVDAQCESAVRCQQIEDRQTCDASVQIDADEFASIEAGVDDGSIKYDSGAAGDCADGIGGNDCKFDGLHEKDPCDDVFKGTVQTGGACVIDLQCANNGNCVQTDPNCDDEVACCAGTCMGSFTESAIGGPCDDDLHFCAVNSYCKTGTSGPGVCTALIAGEGTTCDEIDACENPRYCNLNFQTGTGTCKTPAASGATCSRMELLPCIDSRDYCDMTQLKCIRRVAVGGTCGTGISCVSFASCVNGTCVADLKLGATCNDSTPDCAGSLECISGTCQLPPQSGPVCKLP